MERIKVILLILMLGCAPQITPTEPDIDLKPGRPRYQSQSNIELNKWIEEEWPRKKADTFNVDGFWIIIEQENGKPPKLIKLK